MAITADPIFKDATAQDILTQLTTMNAKLQSLIGAVAPNASDISYSNATSHMSADDVQEAIDELDGSVDTLNASLTNNTFEVPTVPSGMTSNIQIQDGGYIQIGKLVQVNLRVNVINAITSGSHILSGFPLPVTRNNNNLVIGFGGVNQAVGAFYINNSGNLYNYFDLTTGVKLITVTYVCQ